MCLIAIAIEQHKDFPLIILSNRDEFYARPTAPLHEWDEAPIIAGKDLEAGGTWMGINKSGKFAALTNYRDPDRIQTDAKSRGSLVRDYLMMETDPVEYASIIRKSSEQYNGYNILLGDLKRREFVHYSNYENEVNMMSSASDRSPRISKNLL
jgi:uncharacterized protein with NRDE domain